MAASSILYAPDREQVEDGEGETIAEIGQAFDTILERTANDYGHAARSVHAIPEGTLTVEPTVCERAA